MRGYSRIASHFREGHYNEVGVNVTGLNWKGLEHYNVNEARIHGDIHPNCGFPIAQTEMQIFLGKLGQITVSCKCYKTLLQP